MALSTAQATWTLASAHLSTLLQTLRSHLREKRLLFATITIFLGGYMLAAYLLVAKGLEFISHVPLLGPILMDRLIFVLFFFFFAMLVISNATITGIGLFKRRETSWLLSLPLSYRSLVLWKTLEGMVLASWGLILLSAPIVAAIGRMLHATPAFYLCALPALFCLVTVASNLSCWMLLTLIRWTRRSWLKPAAMLAGLGLLITAMRVLPGEQAASNPVDVSANVGQILQHTNYFTHPLLPSSWVAEAVLAAGHGAFDVAAFYNLLLLAYAMLSVVITIHMAGRWFYPAWARSLEASSGPATAPFRTTTRRFPWPAWLPPDLIMRSLMLKDIRGFVREPAQWGQTVLVFGLLFLYMLNLRRIVFDFRDPFWNLVTSYLNLLVCSLSLSTLTTRFIFPQLSLEGQRMWLLGLSPIPMTRVLHAKLLLTTSVTGILTMSLTLISCHTLETAPERTLFFVVAILMMTAGLNGLALGLGALFPDFREQNPAKVVSGFGGTLCLIASFVYIAACITAALIPALPELKPGLARPDFTHTLWVQGMSGCGILLLTLLFGWLPYHLAQKRIKNLDYFGKV